MWLEVGPRRGAVGCSTREGVYALGSFPRPMGAWGESAHYFLLDFLKMWGYDIYDIFDKIWPEDS